MQIKKISFLTKSFISRCSIPTDYFIATGMATDDAKHEETIDLTSDFHNVVMPDVAVMKKKKGKEHALKYGMPTAAKAKAKAKDKVKAKEAEVEAPSSTLTTKCNAYTKYILQIVAMFAVFLYIFFIFDA